jgi:hypothetical protein
VKDHWAFLSLIQVEGITNLKHRRSSWTAININGNFSFARVKNCGFPQLSLQMSNHSKKKKKSKTELNQKNN